MSGDLPVRVASGLVLGAAAILATWAGGLWFVSFCALAGLAMGYEAARLAQAEARAGVFMAVGAATPLAVLADPAVSLAAVGVGALAVSAFSPPGRRGYGAALALYVAGPLALFVALRLGEGGLAAILYLFVVVWTTDIAAYLAGRGFGGPWLAPDGSPNQTWCGWAGALVCAALAGAAASPLIGSGVIVGFVGAAFLSVAAQAGDLFESTLKRRAGLKDASNLIPGHGGVLDRVDGLMAATVAFALWRLLQPVILR